MSVEYPIYFWSRSDTAYRFLSNFYPCSIEWQGVIWPSAEHLYQAEGFSERASAMSMLDDSPGVNIREHIRQFATPAEARKFAQQHSSARRADWHQVNVRVMWNILYLKFDQHPELAKLLDATGQEKLIHYAPWDTFWGSGRDGKGKNKLGVLLMELRAELRK